MNTSQIKRLIQEARGELVLDKTNESFPYNSRVEDIIIKALEMNGYTLEGSGYDFQNKVRDLLFVAENGKPVTIKI